MDFIVQNQLSDDQWALLGCAAALVLSGTLMSLSYFLGQARKSHTQDRSNPGIQLAPQIVNRQEDRRAA